MMLHSHGYATRGAVLRMRVANDERLGAVHTVLPEEIIDRFAKRAKGLIVVEIANVLTHERLAVDHQGNRVLEISPECENWPVVRYRRHRTGRIAATASHEQRPGPYNRVFDSSRDGP